MKECPLSEDLKMWRAERPDEWTMDRFIRKAEKLESRHDPLQEVVEWLESRFEGGYECVTPLREVLAKAKELKGDE